MRSLLLLIPAILLLGCTGCGICLPFPCPQYAPPPSWYYEQCDEKGGHMTAEKNSISCCVGPPYCADENGNSVTITPPTPTPTPYATATPAPSATPTPIPDELRESRCTSSGGSWNSGYCECDGLAYNRTSGECHTCPEGQLVGRGLGDPFCYTPTGMEGEPCDRSTDCNGGSCVLVNESAVTGKGECHDLPFGCYVRIDEEGNFDPEMMLCVD